MKTQMKTLKAWALVGLLGIPGLTAAAGSADPLLFKFMADQLEVWNDGNNTRSWDIFAWAGHDWNKVWVYSEGERSDGNTESENMLLYGRPIAPFWDMQFGVGRDLNPDSGKSWAVVGVNGLAPYFFETQAHLLIGDRVAGLRTSVEYELLFTQFLILTPELEMDWYSADIPEMGYGKGLSNVTAGLRLRYEIRREFAPYIGFQWSKNYGNTADFRRAAGEPIEESSFVTGVRVWF